VADDFETSVSTGRRLRNVEVNVHAISSHLCLPFFFGSGVSRNDPICVYYLQFYAYFLHVELCHPEIYV